MGESTTNTLDFGRQSVEHGESDRAWIYKVAVRRSKPWKTWATNCLASFGLCSYSRKSVAKGREIPLTVQHQLPLIDKRNGRPYISNSIHSSRYNIWDFLPRQFFFQATRLSNFYLICIGIPQAIPGLSPTGSFTTILPLLFFLVLTISKEGWDDFRRHRLDKEENNRETFVLRERHNIDDTKQRQPVPLFRSRTNSKIKIEVVEESEEVKAKLCWNQIKWHTLKVGDIIRLRRDDPVPADIILLSATGESGSACIETTALDGETNFKNKQALPELRCCDTVEGIDCCDAEFLLEDPNPDLYQFEGRVTLNGMTLPLTLNQVIFRGSVIRNTDTVFGLVVNTGEHTKIRMNANQHLKAKKPRLEKFSNQIVLSLFLYVIILTAGCSFGYWLWQRSTERHSWYLNRSSVAWKEIIIGFAIEFNNVIPLALYVSLEIVKIGQALMLNSDLEMYDVETDTRAGCNTNTIIENLGQVSIVLSDKTGTLTENVMQFQKLSVCGISFAMGGSGRQESEGAEQCVTNSQTNAGDNGSNEQDMESLLRIIRDNGEAALSTTASQFITAMAICNTCLPETKEGSIFYQASSPDELALVKAAQDLGCCLVERTLTSAQLFLQDPTGHEEKQLFEILDVIEFSSKRKRMSIIVRTPSGQIRLICKGADNIILSLLKNSEVAATAVKDVRLSVEVEHDRLRKSEQLRRSVDVRYSIDLATRNLEGSGRPSITRRSTELSRVSGIAKNRRADNHLALLKKSFARDDYDIFSRCLRHIHDYANDGLRTLVFAQKVITPEEYEGWKSVYHTATTTLENRQERIEEAAELIEQSLDFLGATAIEDKLQEGVPETIQRLRRANIRIWMLTGDKRETAINIAHSARLCLPESDIFVLDASKEPLQAQLDHIAECLRTDCVHSVVVIDGHTLSVVESDPSLKSAFYALIPTIDSAICCRATPAQKAGLVKAIRSEVPQEVTLAIGDGANDIAMIQASHVGVGISGKEGLQASRVADYSIARFRFLARLLLVHGHWDYMRTAKFILLTFWKEMFFYTMQAMYQRYNGYTGTSLYEPWSLTVLNTLFTSLCVIVPGIFEQDLRAETLLAIPELYRYGQRNSGLNMSKYLRWMAVAAAEGVMVWITTWAVYNRTHAASDQGIFAIGDLVFTTAIVWTNVKAMIFETHCKSNIVLISFGITVSGWWAWNAFLSAAYNPNPTQYGVKNGFSLHFGRDWIWWLTLTLHLGILVLAYISVRVGRRYLPRHNFMTLMMRRGTKGRADNCNVDIEHWQELEQDTVVQEKLASLAKQGMGQSS